MEEQNLKIFLIGDPHFNIRNRQRCLEFSKKCIQKAKKFKKQNKLDLIICLGDIFHTHEKAHMLECKDVTDYLIVECQKICKTIFIIGNHDRLNNSVYCTEDHFLYMYNKTIETVKYLNPTLKINVNLLIVDKPQIYKIKGHVLGLIPYVTTGRFNEALQNIYSKNIKYIFCHQEFKGCKMGYIKSKSGDVSTERNIIFSGHIHDKQIIKHRESIIYYIGTPFQQRFGEDPDKTICFLTIDNSNYNYEEIDLELPKLITKNFSISEFMKFDIIKYANTKLRLIISGEETELNIFKKSKKYKQLKKKGIKFSFDLIRTQKIKIKNVRFIDKFIEIISVNEEAINLFKEINKNL